MLSTTKKPTLALIYFILISSNSHAYEAPPLPFGEDEKVKVTVHQVGRIATVTLLNRSSYRLTYAFVGCHVDGPKVAVPFFRDILESGKGEISIEAGKSMQNSFDTQGLKVVNCLTGTLRGHLADEKKIAERKNSNCVERIHEFFGVDFPFSNRPFEIQMASGKGRYRVEYVDGQNVVRRTVKCFSGAAGGTVAFDD